MKIQVLLNIFKNMKRIIILPFTIILLTSCGNVEKPKVIYTENKNIETTDLKKDSTLIEIANTPIHIDSTNYLIHPIGEYKLYGTRGKESFDSFNYRSGSFSITKYSRNTIKGNINNLKFQQLDSEYLTTLTTKNILIKSVTFLRDIFNNTKKQILIYRVIDKDTNRDNKLDDNDVKTLYISNIDGSKFKKLTPELQELIDWEELAIKNRIYFRSIEDTNKNGEFDKNDKVHYKYIDFSNDMREVIEYRPI